MAVEYGLADPSGEPQAALTFPYEDGAVRLTGNLLRREFPFAERNLGARVINAKPTDEFPRLFIRFSDRQTQVRIQISPDPDVSFVTPDGRLYCTEPLAPDTYTVLFDSRGASISIQELAVSLRIIGQLDEQLDPAIEANLSRVRAAAELTVEEYAGRAPIAVKNEAVVRLASYLYDTDYYPNSAFERSGAKGLLARFRTHTAAVIEGA